MGDSYCVQRRARKTNYRLNTYNFSNDSRSWESFLRTTQESEKRKVSLENLFSCSIIVGHLDGRTRFNWIVHHLIIDGVSSVYCLMRLSILIM